MITDEDSKSKLLIMFVMEKYEAPIERDILAQICCIDNNWIPYFCFEHFVEELCESRLTMTEEDKNNPGDVLLALTDDGKECLGFYYTSIYKSVRDDVNDYIRANLVKYRKQQEFLCKYEKNEDGTYSVHGLVLNGQTVLFRLDFCVPNRRKAEDVSKKWKDAAPEVYKNYVDLMID